MLAMTGAGGPPGPTLRAMPLSRPLTLRLFDTLLLAGALAVIAIGLAGWRGGAPEIEGLAVAALAAGAVVMAIAALVSNTTTTQGSTPFVLGVVLAVLSGAHAGDRATLLPVWALGALLLYVAVLGRGSAVLAGWSRVVVAGQVLILAARFIDLHTAPYDRLLAGLVAYFLALWLLEGVRDRVRGTSGRSLNQRRVVYVVVGVCYAGALIALLNLISDDNESRWLSAGIAGVTILGIVAAWQFQRIGTLRRLATALIQAAVSTPWQASQIDETLVRLVRSHVRARSVELQQRPGEPEALSQQITEEKFLVVRRDRGDFAFSRYDGQLVAGLAAMARASHQLDARVSQLETKAVTDELTGLLEYGAWRDVLEQISAHRAPGEVLGVVFLDLDHFKQMNGEYGHLRADTMLAELGKRLRAGSRDWRFGRFGGDEFVGVVRDVRNEAHLDELCAELAALVAEPVQAEGRTIRGTATIGRALSHARTDGTARIIGRAETDLRKRKAARPITARPTDEQVMNRLLGGGLQVAYQPVFDVGTGQLHGWEALLRDSLGDHGPVGPEHLVRAAERIGVLDTLTHEVARRAVETADEASRRLGRRLAISINLETSQLGWDSPLLEWLMETAGTSQAQIVVELSERGDSEWSAEEDAIVAELERHGIGLALDDIGAGQARLQALARRTWSWIKLDRTFLTNDTRGEVMLQHYLEMLHELDMPVVLEGIETDRQLELARSLGVDYVQGIAIGEPIPAEALLDTLDTTGLALQG